MQFLFTRARECWEFECMRLIEKRKGEIFVLYLWYDGVRGGRNANYQHKSCLGVGAFEEDWHIKLQCSTHWQIGVKFGSQVVLTSSSRVSPD